MSDPVIIKCLGSENALDLSFESVSIEMVTRAAFKRVEPSITQGAFLLIV